MVEFCLYCTVHCPHTYVHVGIDSLLTTLRSLGMEGGGMEGGKTDEGLCLLEKMLHSNTFKKAQKVGISVCVCVCVCACNCESH